MAIDLELTVLGTGNRDTVRSVWTLPKAIAAFLFPEDENVQVVLTSMGLLATY